MMMRAMKMVLALACAAVLTPLQAEAASVTASTRIVGGVVISPKIREWMAAMIIVDYTTNEEYLCGSSYIGSSDGYHYMLTAGHCIPSGELQPVAMFLRDDLEEYDSDSFNLVDAVGIVVHPDFVENEDGSTDNDLALVIFKDANVDLPTSALLAGEYMTVYPGENATVSGYGTTSSGGSTDYELRQTTLDIVNETVCGNDYASMFTIIPSEHICAAAPGRDSCQGDSGGPLTVHPYEGAEEVEVGLVAFGYGCAYPGYPGVYTRLSTYESWIRATVNSTSPNGDTSGLRFYDSPYSNSTFVPTAAPTAPTPSPTKAPTTANSFGPGSGGFPGFGGGPSSHRSETINSTSSPTMNPTNSPTSSAQSLMVSCMALMVTLLFSMY